MISTNIFPLDIEKRVVEESTTEEKVDTGLQQRRGAVSSKRKISLNQKCSWEKYSLEENFRSLENLKEEFQNTNVPHKNNHVKNKKYPGLRIGLITNNKNFVRDAYSVNATTYNN